MNTRGAAASSSRKRKASNDSPGISGSRLNSVVQNVQSSGSRKRTANNRGSIITSGPATSNSTAITPPANAPTSSVSTANASTHNDAGTTDPRKRKAHEAVSFEGHTYHKNGGTSDGSTEYFECSE